MYTFAEMKPYSFVYLANVWRVCLIIGNRLYPGLHDHVTKQVMIRLSVYQFIGDNCFMLVQMIIVKSKRLNWGLLVIHYEVWSSSVRPKLQAWDWIVVYMWGR